MTFQKLGAFNAPWSDDADDEVSKIAQIAGEPHYDPEAAEFELFWRTLLRLMPEDQLAQPLELEPAQLVEAVRTRRHDVMVARA